MGTVLTIGKVRPLFKGEYSDAVECTYYNCYKYNGTWWLHIGESPTTGIAPTEGAVWTAFGVKGDKGDVGGVGDTGDAATISVGTVTTSAPGSNATVTNSGTVHAAVFDFTLPRGVQGPQGEKGDPFTVKKTYPSVAAMEADFSGTDTVEGDFVMITSNVEDEDNAKLYVKGATAWTYVTDLSGSQGMKGDAATITVGTVTTSAAGTQATITNSGTTSAAVFDFTIPKGDTGVAATITVGTVTTGAAGTQAAVTNSGTANAAVFDFAIPQGAKGDPGDSITAASINENGELTITVG